MPDIPRLYYGHDPMCSFCWAFRPVWEQLRSILDQRFPTIEVVYVMGGLAPDSDEPMPEALQQKLQSTWRHIQELVPGTRFNFDFWRLQQPRRSTYPACRAVIAARQMAPALEEAMILAIQTAYYLQAQNPSNEDTLVACAESIGLDPAVFSEKLHSEACDREFNRERQLSHRLGISSFPSLVIAGDETNVSIPIDYNDAQAMLRQIQAGYSLGH